MMIVINGRPVPCVRMTQKSKWSKPAQRYLAYKGEVGREVGLYFHQPLEGWVKVKVRFYFKDNKLPDLDNLVKAILDGCNKIAFLDDKQVVQIEAERLKDSVERAEIEILEVS